MRWWQWQRVFRPIRESEADMLPLESLGNHEKRRNRVRMPQMKLFDSYSCGPSSFLNNVPTEHAFKPNVSFRLTVSAMLRRGVHVSERFLRGPLWSDEYSETYRMRSILHSGYGRDIDCQMRLETETSVDRGLSPFSFWLWNSIPESGGKINCTKSSVSR
jgi:hypothetical protein